MMRYGRPIIFIGGLGATVIGGGFIFTLASTLSKFQMPLNDPASWIVAVLMFGTPAFLTFAGVLFMLRAIRNE